MSVRDGHAPVIPTTNGIPQGPTVRGPWGSIYGWSDDTQAFTVCIRPPRPRSTPPPPAAEPPRSIATPTGGWLPCPAVRWHGVSFKYLNAKGHQVCRACQRERARSWRQRRSAA